MTSSVPSITRQEVNTLLRQIQGTSLLNRQLSSVCQVNGLKSTGVKAELQRRISDLIQDAVNHNDVSRFHQIRHSITNAVEAQRPSPSKGLSARSNASFSQTSPPSMPQHRAANYTPGAAYGSGTGSGTSSVATNGHRPPSYAATTTTPSTPSLSFKRSPFYKVEQPLGTLRVCDAAAQHRNSILIPIKFSDHPSLQRCLDDKSYRVMVFCAGDNTGVQDIAFPHQAELKVNGGEIKASLRGVKGKPGSTRPVDITNALHLRGSYMNNVEFTYALTKFMQKFYLQVNICKITSVPELVNVVSTRRKIPKESVVAELNQKAQDPDVVATAQVLSLKCPLSYMRLEVPCRSLSCTHIQCFDATSYLQLQEQGPLWVCPTCSKPAPFEQLAVDEYVRDILENTPKSLEAVTIEPNGRWSIKSAHDEASSMLGRTSLGDDDDDDYDLEVSEISAGDGNILETPRLITPSTSTPASGARDSSASTPRIAPPGSAKRPAPTVIDLTISSDEEEPIQRPRKRVNVGRNGHRGPRLGFLSDTPSQ